MGRAPPRPTKGPRQVGRRRAGPPLDDASGSTSHAPLRWLLLRSTVGEHVSAPGLLLLTEGRRHLDPSSASPWGGPRTRCPNRWRQEGARGEETEAAASSLCWRGAGASCAASTPASCSPPPSSPGGGLVNDGSASRGSSMACGLLQSRGGSRSRRQRQPNPDGPAPAPAPTKSQRLARQREHAVGSRRCGEAGPRRDEARRDRGEPSAGLSSPWPDRPATRRPPLRNPPACRVVLGTNRKRTHLVWLLCLGCSWGGSRGRPIIVA